MAKIAALKSCWRLSRWGADVRSQLLLFRIGLINSIDRHRRVALLERLHAAVAPEALGGVLQLLLRPPRVGKRASPIPIQLRARNDADYQSIFECLGSIMYPAPETPIYHVFDGGSNIGFFSLAASRLPHVKDIIMVEPHPGNVCLLRQNVSFLPTHEVSCELSTVALSGEERDADFELTAANTSHLRGSPGHDRSPHSTVVPCRRLVSLLPSHWNMNHTWLKLDIEGAEYEVLRDLLQSDRRPIAISAECHDYLHAGGAQLVQDLRMAGYRVQVKGRGVQGIVCRQISALYTT